MTFRNAASYDECNRTIKVESSKIGVHKVPLHYDSCDKTTAAKAYVVLILLYIYSIYRYIHLIVMVVSDPWNYGQGETTTTTITGRERGRCFFIVFRYRKINYI